PLQFEEFYKIPSKFIYVSATPDSWEVEQSKQEVKMLQRDGASVPHDGIVEQLIRPTGIVDPKVTIRPATSEIPDLVKEIEERAKKGEKVLVTTLTKKTAEDLTEYVKEKNVRAAYLHSDIHTL